MKVSAVLLARALVFVETVDLDPKGHVFYPDFVRELVARYQFQKFPTKIEELDETKGVEFIGGKDGNIVIQKMVIYNTGILVDTRENTTASLSIINSALEWGKSKFGLAYTPEVIRRIAYVSDLTFFSDVPINALNPALVKLSDKVSSAVTEAHQGTKFEFQATSLMVSHDPLKRKYPVASFTIQPRAEAPFSEHKYFSEAPLTTDLHIKFLEEYEEDVKASIAPAASAR